MAAGRQARAEERTRTLPDGDRMLSTTKYKITNPTWKGRHLKQPGEPGRGMPRPVARMFPAASRERAPLPVRASRADSPRTLPLSHIGAAGRSLLRAWTCVSTLGLAALLGPVPASAQTAQTTLVSPTVTVGIEVYYDQSNGHLKDFGYVHDGDAYPLGSIENDSFEYENTTYTIQVLVYYTNTTTSGVFGPAAEQISLGFSSALPEALLQSAVLSSGSIELDLSDARVATGAYDVVVTYRWDDVTSANNPFAGVSEDDEVEFDLFLPASTNNAPVFADSTLTRTVAENTAADMNVGAAVTATDADTDTLTYSLEGTDAASFTIDSSTGQIKTKTGVSYDHETKASYAITVKAADGNGGTDTVAVTVNVTDVDEPPAAPAAPAVSAVAGSHTDLDVAWSTPANTGPMINSYDLQYQQSGAGSWTNGPQDVTGTSDRITVPLADTEYEVRVRATNNEGDSDWSPAGSGTTNPEPLSTDATLASLELHDTPIGINPPPALIPLDPPFVSDTTDYRADPVRAEENLLKLTVTPNSPNAMVVLSMDSDDPGLTVTTTANIVLSVGQNTITLAVTAEDGITTKTYTVTVERLPYTPEIRGWELVFVPENLAPDTNIGDPVTARHKGGLSVTFTLVGADANAFTIGSLSGQIKTKTGVSYNYEDKKHYEFMVRADDGNGGTDTEEVDIYLTNVDEQPATPAPPRVSGSFLSLDVSWTLPDQNGGPYISGYAVQYRRGTSVDWLDHTHTGPDRSTTIPRLMAGTEYQVRVRAQNGELDSEWSEPGSGTTLGAGVTLSTASLVLSEGGSMTYTAVLASQPTGRVTVALVVSGDTDVTVSPASLTFTTTTWNRPQTVTVSAAQDPGNQDDAAVVSHQVTGANYAGVRADDVRVTVTDDEPHYGRINAYFRAVKGGADEVAGWGGPLPDIHSGEPFQLAVHFSRAGNYVLLTGRCQPLTWEQYQVLTGFTVCERGPAPAQWLGPGGALRVTGATVRLIATAYHRIRMELTPTGAEDVTVTVQPLPCPAAGAMCRGSDGLDNSLHLRVRGVSGPPEAPQHVIVQRVYWNENQQPDLRVTFDLDPVGTHYRIQYQRAGLVWASFGEETGWRGQRRSGRENHVLFDVPAGRQAHDVRVRWENLRGAGPWTTLYDVGGQGSQGGPPEVERIERHGDKIWIFFTRGLDTGVNIGGVRGRFEVHYSESAPAGHPDTWAGNSWRRAEIVNERNGPACTSNGQACRIVRLTLSPVTRGGVEYPGPSEEETVSVSYSHAPDQAHNLRAVGAWHAVPHVPEFSRVVAEPVGSTPALRVADGEGSEGSNPAVRFVVTLVPTSTTEEVTVSYATRPGTARPGADYVHTSGMLTFAPGEWRKTVDVPIVDDAVDDSGETFTLRLFNATGAEIAADQATGTILNHEEGSPQTGAGTALTAAFGGLPHGHGGAAFTFRLTFSEAFAVTADQIRAGLTITGGSLTGVARTVAGENGSWDVTVTPTTAAEAVTVTLTPKESCETAGAVCTAAGRGLEEAVEATVPGRAPTGVVSASLTSGPGETGTWDTGERVEAAVRFSAPVRVSGGTPTLGIVLDGTRREAAYTGGSGTDTLTFAHTVTAEDDGARRARIVANGLSRNGATVLDDAGREVELRFAVAPYVTAVAVAADASGDREWTAGEAIEVRLTFSEAVRVADGMPWLEVNIAGWKWPAAISYASGSGSATLVFSTDVPETSGGLTGLAVQADSLVANRATVVSAASWLAAELAHDGTEPTAAETGAGNALTAAFHDWPDAHGSAAFTFQLRFSEEFSLSYLTLKDHAIGVTNGTLTGVSRVTPGENREWNVTVTPEGSADVTVALAATTDCTATGAICNADDVRLSAAVTETVPRTVSAETPFKVRLVGVPAEHDGTDEIVFRVMFNKKPKADYSYVTMRDSTLRIRRDGVTLTPKVKRLNKPHNDRWEVKVTPGSKEDLSVSIGPFTSCSDEGAVCTAASEVLANKIDKTIKGPPGLSVADARVHENVANATVDFPVTLGRASLETVTVAYATADGTATADQDYEPTSGTLTFAPGDTVKTVSVPVLPDVIDDTGETFTLTLSNPQGGNAYLADPEATGTIENSDPLPHAWLGRFGRTVGTHVTDAVGDRLRAVPGQGSHLTVGGYRLPLGQAGRDAGSAAGQPGSGAATDATAAEASASALLQGLAGVLGLGGAPAGGSGDTAALTGRGPGWDPWLDGPGPRLGQSQTLNLDLRQVLLGSSFRLNVNAAQAGGGPRLTAWGRFAGTRFASQDGTLSLDGDVLTGTVGVDGEWDRVLAGVAVAHSRGDGGYRSPDDTGELENTLTSLHPYLRYAVTDRLNVWGMLGYGWGQLELEQGTGAAFETDTHLVMGAFGGRGILLAADETGGFQLATRTDAMLTRTTSDAVTGQSDGNGTLAASEADAHRLRLVLEGSRGVTWADGRTLTPTMEVGLRHDWGDAETGFGLELGGRVHYADPTLGLTVEATVRGLLAHEDSDYQEWGASGTVRIAPGATGQGLSLTLSPTWGAAASGVDGLWSRQTTAGLAPQSNRRASAGQLTAEVGYGLPVLHGDGLLTPYAGTVLAAGSTRTYRLGTRLHLGTSWAQGLQLNLEATRQEPAGQQPATQGVRLQATWSF